MTIEERRQREKEQRRTAIVDAAERVFFAKGFDQATVDEIADCAELSKGTLYLYFDGKDDLYRAIIFRALKLLTTAFEKAIARHETGIEKVWAIGTEYVNFYREHPDYFDALIHYHGQKTETFYEHDPLKVLIDVVQEGIADGTIRSGLDPLKTAIILWGQTTGLLQIAFTMCEAIRDAYRVDPEEIISYYFDLTYHNLKAG
ncbi:MAG: TetR/AcrR family transcriptional regulator [bacterium]|nr:MAG: TetR/AcrR family transcriptional regulator [bacterium]